ncbi:hypothetical protein PL2TA16_02091 [Pseudoalteromonas luteoviolacea 2ta16]|uniref:Uncharacterized protein n=1 Tax=Pseudoalteromonas luteoviolacea (strain 2ta16) TaxID=1353533 RepID=V4H9T5_PSEL2|nr:hypothetical protein [Pseudoalteromonas luteoviolacea]ESP94246.1 hypothetical protein PL2TA16_02091 [Pseudoalteromonas luteoviolacea 2ta16]
MSSQKCLCATYVTSSTGGAFVFSPDYVGGVSIKNSVGDSRVIGGN